MAQDVRALRWPRTWPLAISSCLLLLGLRSWFYLGWEESYFSSDQAIVGLMAKHLAERRAWPLFFYGQEYQLAVEAWVAAPFTLLLGSSVATLRLTLVFLNVVTGLLLLRLLTREAGLDLWSAVLASTPFWIAPVIPAASLVEAAGVNIEPFLWVLAAWTLRRHPLGLGVCLGVGFLNREFMLYAVPPLVLSQISERGRIDRPLIASWVLTATGFLLVVQVVAALTPYVDIYGPGTAGLAAGSRSVALQLVERATWDPGLVRPQLLGMVSDYLPLLLGISNVLPGHYGIGTSLNVGWPVLRAPLAIIVVAIIAWLAVDLSRARRIDVTLVFPLYLVAVGATAACAYAMFRPYSLATTRYGLLFLYVPIGFVAIALQPARTITVRALAAAGLSLLATGSVIDHARVIAAAHTSPPHGDIRAIVNRLDHDGATAVWAGYWHAYAITFLSQERVGVAAINVPRIAEYGIRAAAAEAAGHRVVVIQTEPCASGELVGEAYVCPR